MINLHICILIEILLYKLVLQFHHTLLCIEIMYNCDYIINR